MKPPDWKLTLSPNLVIGSFICLVVVAIFSGLIRATIWPMSVSDSSIQIPHCDAPAGTPVILDEDMSFNDQYSSLAGSLLFVMHGALYRLNVTDSELTNLTPDLPSVQDAFWSPDRRLAILSLAENDIRIFNLATADVWPVTITVSDHHAFLWSPDSRRLAVRNFSSAQNDPGSVTLFDIQESGETTPAEALTLFNSGPIEWSPDGKWMIIPDAIRGNWDLTPYVLYKVNPPHGSESPRLFAASYPQWSPDGKWIAAQCIIDRDDGFADWQMCLNDPHTLEPARIYDTDALNGTEVAWSPDSRWLGISSYNGEGKRILSLVDVRTGEVTIPACTGPTTSITWSPDSQHLLYETDDKTAVLDPATGRSMLVSDTPFWLNDAVWSSDGSHIAGRLNKSSEGTMTLIVFSLDGANAKFFTLPVNSVRDSFQDLVWLQP